MKNREAWDIPAAGAAVSRLPPPGRHGAGAEAGAAPESVALGWAGAPSAASSAAAGCMGLGGSAGDGSTATLRVHLRHMTSSGILGVTRLELCRCLLYGGPMHWPMKHADT